MVNINTLAQELTTAGHTEKSGFPFEVNPIPGEVEVLQIVVEDREELPIFISANEDQILCIAYLFHRDEIKDGMEDAMNRDMLLANISIPLSSFARIDEQYVIYGALAVSSKLEDIVHEIEILSSNTLDAIEAMRHYLK